MFSGQINKDAITHPIDKLLIANRGEIAIRIARTAAELNIPTVAIYAQDDADNLHVKRCDESIALPGAGARAYLDIEAVINAAKQAGATAVHPGYGFLSENAEFAQRVSDAGLIFVGPTAETLALLGDKITAKTRAQELDVPTLPGTSEDTDLDAAQAFFAELPEGASMVIKAVAGGGGRGMRVVHSAEDVADAWARCRSEAEAAFGLADVYVERFLPSARHIEVQILGDGRGQCVSFGERECTLQRRHQKVIEIAPSPTLTQQERNRIENFAKKLAASADYRSLGTFEFLMAADDSDGERFFFIEANPRIQVEHTITEAVYGVDLVRLQLAIASGASLSDFSHFLPNVQAKGFAIQCRINMESMDAQAHAQPTSGTVRIYEPPTGAGIRVDGFAYSGYQSSSRFDGLLAKLIVHSDSDDFAVVAKKAIRALKEFRIVGIETNLPWLRALLSLEAVQANQVTTRFIEQHAEQLAATATEFTSIEASENSEQAPPPATQTAADIAIPEGAAALTAPMQATVVALEISEGDDVIKGQPLVILEAMKMEHVLTAEHSGKVQTLLVEPGQTLKQAQIILLIQTSDGAHDTQIQETAIDLEHIRDDLQEFFDRRAASLDESRPEAVAKRHARGHQTARENLAQICDSGTFVEYGQLALAAQSRRTLEDLIRNTSGDGILTGLGSVNGDTFSEDKARCAFAIGDYMVLAGTQGARHHRKLDRLFSLADDWNIPVVLFAEGGGGRPGDSDNLTVSGVSCETFTRFANLSGKVPLVGVVSGRCFAGNAAFLGCCDVIIADESSNIGMAGPP